MTAPELIEKLVDQYTIGQFLNNMRVSKTYEARREVRDALVTLSVWGFPIERLLDARPGFDPQSEPPDWLQMDTLLGPERKRRRWTIRGFRRQQKDEPC